MKKKISANVFFFLFLFFFIFNLSLPLTFWSSPINISCKRIDAYASKHKLKKSTHFLWLSPPCFAMFMFSYTFFASKTGRQKEILYIPTIYRMGSNGSDIFESLFSIQIELLLYVSVYLPIGLTQTDGESKMTNWDRREI